LFTIHYATYERSGNIGSDTFAEIIRDRRVTSEHRRLHGGTGPLTHEDGVALDNRCRKQ
jgi:hypothetical protein